jgi:VWFA-related protein
MFFQLKSTRSPLMLAAIIALAGIISAQQAPTSSSDAKVVNVLATVRDKHGNIVGNLSQDDFVLDEDGRPQAVRSFAREADLPLTLGLLVDTSPNQRRVLDQERSASGGFVEHVLREDKDKVFLIHFDREVELLQDLTSSRQKLADALRLLQTTQPARDSASGNSGGGGGYPGAGRDGAGRSQRRGGGALLYDSIFLAADELMQKPSGRKVMVVLSDGVDRGSKKRIEQAIESAQRANTAVYSILFADRESDNDNGGWQQRGGMGGRAGGPWGGRQGGGYPYPRQPQPQQERPDGKKILERISKETGGRMFEVSKKQTVDQIYQQIQNELRSQYNLGYTPDTAGAGSGYHRIHLTTKEKDLAVQVRDGYYSAK